MKLEDLNKYVSYSSFVCTNEEPEVHRELLKGITLRRAAGIASGGEISFFLLLPRITKELVVVDHSYKSLAAFYTKALLLEKLGAKVLRDLILNEPVAKFEEQINLVHANLPVPLQNQFPVGNNVGLTAPNEMVNLRKAWFYTSPNVINRAVKKLDKLTLLHGDLMDLKDRGPFDLLYLSNAHEHTGRSGLKPNEAIYGEIVGPDGKLLVAASYGTKAAFSKWKVVREKLGFNSTYSWNYRLMERIKAEEKAA